ncbi:hypothetical protein BN2537_941 [Streptomyces venezuelae]|nr:hypothetical protein BN2537_941 [Streptomyces venezuelae]
MTHVRSPIPVRLPRHRSCGPGRSIEHPLSGDPTAPDAPRAPAVPPRCATGDADRRHAGSPRRTPGALLPAGRRRFNSPTVEDC